MKTPPIFVVGLILLAATCQTLAAAAPVSFTENGQQLNQAPGRNVVLGDFNADGALDAFVVNHADYRVYFGDGRGQFTDSGQRLICPAGWTIPSVGDIDGDGDPDVVTGRTAWLNDGQGRFTAQNDAVETAESGKLSGRLADLNGDGRLDFFAIHDINAMRVYLNDGHGRFRDTGQRLGDGTIGKGQLTLIALGDIDGNGSIDAVTAGWRWDGSKECPNHVWLNDGKGSFRDSGQLLDEGASHVHGLALGDLNGDGKLDLIMGIQDPNRGGRVYLNDGKGGFIAGENLAGVGVNNVALADFDGDGGLDIFLTCSRQPNVVCLNDGAGHFRDSGLRLGPAKDWSWDVATGDFNADGKPDAFVVTCRSFMNPAPAQVWINTTVKPALALDKRIPDKTPAPVVLEVTTPHTGKIVYNQKYRYVMKHRFRKTKPGEALRFVYLPVPPSNDYQEISNAAAPGGELFDSPGSRQKYARYSITNSDGAAWAEVTLEFDYVPKGTEFEPAVVRDVAPYDTTSELYKEYTASYYGFIDTNNAALRKASDMLWSRSANAYDYARKCLAYVTETFEFKDVGTGWYSISDLVARNGGDCGNLSSLFITLLRCKQVPARHVIMPGHAWAEFFVENHGWIPVDPTFKLFGNASRTYERLVWSHDIVFVLQTSGTNSFRTQGLCQGHVLYPGHEPYECSQENTLREIKQ